MFDSNCCYSLQAAEKAVAQSNREISGYQVASISMTADRIAHYQQVTGGSQDQPMADDKDQAGPPLALTLQALLPHLSTSLPLAGREGLLHGHQQVRTLHNLSEQHVGVSRRLPHSSLFESAATS